MSELVTEVTLQLLTQFVKLKALNMLVYRYKQVNPQFNWFNIGKLHPFTVPFGQALFSSGRLENRDFFSLQISSFTKSVLKVALYSCS